jgi:hypothetical protein
VRRLWDHDGVNHVNDSVAALDVGLNHFGTIDFDDAIASDRETLPLHGLR